MGGCYFNIQIFLNFSGLPVFSVEDAVPKIKIIKWEQNRFVHKFWQAKQQAICVYNVQYRTLLMVHQEN